jgi:hypothetical protein
MTYPGLPGTGSAVGNVGSAGEEEGAELGFSLSDGELLVVVLDGRPRRSVAAADLLRGSRRTDTGFGYRE